MGIETDLMIGRQCSTHGREHFYCAICMELLEDPVDAVFRINGTFEKIMVCTMSFIFILPITKFRQWRTLFNCTTNLRF